MADELPRKRPFLKWAGSKTKLVGSIKPLLPLGEFRLVEPFVAAGAVFVNTEYRRNLLCDSNTDLICLYQVLHEHGAKFVKECERLFILENNQEDKFYELRNEFNFGGDAERHAALFLYLNRHCYNGLCRYNQDGQFNVPFGRYDNPYFPREEMLAFAARLKSATIKTQDFRVCLWESGEGDVVYCDPPYIPLSTTSNFTDYASGGFSIEDQQDLAASAMEAARRGAFVVISNHDTTVTRRLYAAAAEIRSVLVSRTISCDGSNRGKAKEIIAVFRPEHKASTQGTALSIPLNSGTISSWNLGSDGMRTLKNTTRHWLLANHYEDVADLIDKVVAKYEKEGVRTRRNWWDTLAGDKKGDPAVVKGVKFPVLRAARLRKGWDVTPGALCRNRNETFPPVRETARWSGKN